MQVGALATLPKDPGSIPQDPCGCLQPSTTPPVLEDLTPTSVGTAHTWWTDIQAGKASIYLKINKIKNKTLNSDSVNWGSLFVPRHTLLLISSKLVLCVLKVVK